MRQRPVMRSDGMGAMCDIAFRLASAETSSCDFFASITFGQISVGNSLFRKIDRATLPTPSRFSVR